MNIRFKKVTGYHLGTIFSWLAEPHIMEFWDNTQAHKVAQEIWNIHPGKWEVSVIPENQSAFSFW